MQEPASSKRGGLVLTMSVIAFLASGCASSVRKWPAAERPRERRHVDLEYESASGERRPLRVGYVQAGGGEDLYVLLHGLATNADTWARVIDGYAAHGSVLALDLPGCGWSDAPGDLDYELEQVADVARQFLERAPELAGTPAHRPPVVVAQSLGAGIAVYLTGTRQLSPRALVLSGPAGYPLKLPFFFQMVRGPLGPTFLWLSTLVPSETLAGLVYNREEVLTQDLGEMLAAQRRDPERRQALWLTFRNAVDVELAERLHPIIRDIETPTFVVFGQDDRIIPSAQSRRWEADLQNGHVVVLPGCGHAVNEERPEEYLELVGEFLDWPREPRRTGDARN